MYKFMAVVRTIFLVFIIVYTFLVAPAAIWGSATVTVTMEAMRQLQRATFIAIGWIGLETLIGWIVAAFKNGRKPMPRPQTPPAPHV